MSDQIKRTTLYGKALPFERGVSGYLARSISGQDDIRALEYAVRMIEWRMHRKLIVEISGLPEMTIERLRQRDVEEDIKQGRPSTSMAKLLQDPFKHLDGSLFITILRNYIDPIERVVTAHAFIEAYALTIAANAVDGDEIQLGPDEAWLVLATGYAQKKIKLVECDVCTTPFVRSVEAVTVNRAQIFGDCPHCRQLVAKDGFSPVQLSPCFVNRSRDILEGYAR